jgi:hypothetical protein
MKKKITIKKNVKKKKVKTINKYLKEFIDVYKGIEKERVDLLNEFNRVKMILTTAKLNSKEEISIIKVMCKKIIELETIKFNRLKKFNSVIQLISVNDPTENEVYKAMIFQCVNYLLTMTK